VVSSKIYWFSINTNGYGLAPISMISSSATGAQADSSGNYYVMSNSSGSFNITAWNTCPSSTTSMYVLALGGDTGSGQNNPNIAMVTLIPVTCGKGWNVRLSEINTVAAAFGLGAFASIATNSFATDINSAPALQAGIAYANSLASSSTGAVPSGSAWQTTIDTLADILADCSVDPTQCPSLFAATTPPGGTAPTNEFQAALNIALNPTLNLTGPFNAIPSGSGWTPILSSYPADWSMPGSSIQITGITPSPAPVGATITIAGSGFGSTQGSGTIVINGIQASITSWSDTAIVAVVPSGAGSYGVVQVFQNNSSSNRFHFDIGPIIIPAITSLSLNQGPPQMGFVIQGTNFGSFQGSSTVTLGNIPLIVLNWSSTAITVQLPQAGVSSGNIVVTVGGAPSFPVNFTVTAPFGCSTP
jgi:hypothetical protein